MEIHFYEYQTARKYINCIFGWIETVIAIRDKDTIIHTTQMGLLNTKLFEDGYRVFVHPIMSNAYEIKLGENDYTGRLIKMEHNLFKLWVAGEFEKG